MAKNTKATGKSLVIVESPAKARTISKYLGKGYIVEASIGHIRDLPEGAKDVPEEYKGQPWARLGVNVDQNFEPLYVVPADKKQHVAKLKKALKEADQLYLATDEDREGEAISWHLCEVLQPKIPVHRLVFHEITEEAILDSLSHPRDIDAPLVRAQETRRILDRLYGYEVSPLLWRKVGPRLSAGRVQSVAVRLIVERERQRIAFRSATYWDLLGSFAAQEGKPFQADLVSVNGRKIPSGKDFDSATGKIKDPAFMLLDEAAAAKLMEQLKAASFRVTNVEDKPYTTRPWPPFTTSTLQQEANRKLGFTARQTMSVAQYLYENGYITYMRTDSTNLAQVAVDAARELVKTEYGQQFLPGQPRLYKSKVKNAQEAHEAIRPAGHPFKLPETLRNELTPDQFRLFDLIWKRTIASQMEDARGRRIMITIEGDGAVFQVSGKTIDFPGYLRAYVEGSDDPEAELADRETLLPPMKQNDSLECRDIVTKSHTTQPPARFSEASLTQTLEEMGIGRPSTYAAIIDTILARQYVYKKANALVPTWVAFSVARLMETHLPKLVDYQFTAQMEDLLDEISRGESGHIDYLKKFYFGTGDEGLKKLIELKLKDVDAREMSRFPLGHPEGAAEGDDVFVRVGKFGPFLERGEARASIPDGMAPDELTLAKGLELLENSATVDVPIGYSPDNNKPIFLKQGRFGPYVQMGEPEDEEKKNASLLKGMQPSDVTLEVALKLLTLPRNLGQHPELNDKIMACNGPYGPYVKCAKETRSLPADIAPTDVTFEQAVALLAQPKVRGKGRGAAKEPLKTFAPSPVTDQPVRILAGRYGTYVTDGESNATLPKELTPETITFEQSLALLAERASKSPPKKKKGAKKAPAKKAAKKAATPKDESKPAKAPKKAAKKKAEQP